MSSVYVFCRSRARDSPSALDIIPLLVSRVFFRILQDSSGFFKALLIITIYFLIKLILNYLIFKGYLYSDSS